MSDSLVVDTSAVVSILLLEGEASWFEEAISMAPDAAMSAGTLQELVLVLKRRNRRPGNAPIDSAIDVDEAVRRYGIDIVPVNEELALLGAVGSFRYGGRPAKLNYGDGFAYALAKQLDAPILCKGDDFIHTDVEVLRPPSR